MTSCSWCGDLSVRGSIGAGIYRCGDLSVRGSIGVGIYRCGDRLVWGSVGAGICWCGDLLVRGSIGVVICRCGESIGAGICRCGDLLVSKAIPIVPRIGRSPHRQIPAPIDVYLLRNNVASVRDSAHLLLRGSTDFFFLDNIRLRTKEVGVFCDVCEGSIVNFSLFATKIVSLGRAAGPILRRNRMHGGVMVRANRPVKRLVAAVASQLIRTVAWPQPAHGEKKMAT